MARAPAEDKKLVLKFCPFCFSVHLWNTFVKIFVFICVFIIICNAFVADF